MFYSVDLKNEIVTVVDLGKRSVIITTEGEDYLLFELSDFGFAKTEKSEPLEGDPYFEKYVKENPFYFRSIVKTIFEKKVEVEDI